jgi:poly(A) polymerase
MRLQFPDAKISQQVSTASLAVEIMKVLRHQGHQAYLVGGCVRDRLLGQAPKDYDVATDATPEKIISYFPDSDLVGAHFGVVLVHDQDGAHVEVATFRSDGVYLDGRRPDHVQFETDPRQDAIRRDFTINALFEDPLSEVLLDFVGGQQDLRDSIVRAIGDPEQRFTEDHLRMLRAVRFAARLGFVIHPDTLAAMQRLAPRINTISAERIRTELTRILTQEHARRGLELLDESGLLAVLLPEVKALQGVEQPPQYHPEGDVWIHTLMMLDMLHEPSETLAWSVLLHDIGKPPTFRRADRIRFDGHAEVGTDMARDILERLKFSRDASTQVQALIANHMRFKDVPQMRPSTRKRFLQLPHFEEHLELHRIDCSCSNGYLDVWREIRDELAQTPAEQLNPKPLISGRDLIAAGFTPGPAFGKTLEQVESAQLDGSIHTKAEALKMAEELLRSQEQINADG